MQDDPAKPHPDADRSARIAMTLMKMALALLDRCGETSAAARLQHAIDSMSLTRSDDR